MSFPHAPRSADRREEVVAAGEADDDKMALVERPNKIATVETDMARSRLRRGTITQVTSP
jgi:hypothetical protein